MGQRLVVRAAGTKSWADVLLVELDLGAVWVDGVRLVGAVTFESWDRFEIEAGLKKGGYI